MNVPQKLLQFGAIPYRASQNMLIAGKNNKFRKYFAVNIESQVGLTDGLKKTIEYYRNAKS